MTKDQHIFLQKVNQTESCWVWTGLKWKGYGIVVYEKRRWRANRLAYELFVGPIPDGKIVHHDCKNKACVNPKHLILTTNSEHPDSAPGLQRAMTHCIHGHSLKDAYKVRSMYGYQRCCRTCTKQRADERYQKIRKQEKEILTKMSPKMSASKEEITGQQELLPAGLYDVILKGFNPRTSKKGDSINLNPDIRIINHSTLNDKKVFMSLNTNAPFMWAEFCHTFGCPLESDGDGDDSIPGQFDGVDFQTALKLGPQKKVPWTYTGPLLNQQGKLVVGQVQRDGQPKPQNDIQQFVCRVSGCDYQHKDNLIKS